MLYTFLSNYHRLFEYLTVRIGLAAVTAFVITVFLGPWFINWLKRMQVGQVIRDDGPEAHRAKEGTPTMGGILMVVGILVSSVVWANLAVPYVQVTLVVLILFGAVGFADDYIKLVLMNPRGLRGAVKFVIEAAVIFAVITYLVGFDSGYTTHLSIPFWKKYTAIDLGWAYPLFALVVIAGAANGVNLTDGLDGLAITPLIICCLTYLIFAYVVGRSDWSAYLLLPYIRGAGEVGIICAAMAGAGMGFLWFNTYPAEVFMGDVGSLAMGGALGTVAVVTKHELVLAIAGGLFVMEAVSVMLQVASFKLRGKRVFRMAPLHHHFELKGWPEPKIIVRFWILSVIFCLLALGTLKVR